MKLLRIIKAWLYVVYLSCKWMFVINLGDLVRYNGRQYRVINGVRPEMWRMIDLENGDNGWVPRSECQKVWTLKNMIGSFKSGYQFYMRYWFPNWSRCGIKWEWWEWDETNKGDLKS